MTEAYLALVEAKERAGIERAVGAAGFDSGFSPELHTRFVRLGAEQQSYLAQFRATAAESFVTDHITHGRGYAPASEAHQRTGRRARRSRTEDRLGRRAHLRYPRADQSSRPERHDRRGKGGRSR
ncbi:hypothetical protein CKO28_26265 [Rhodovibrio sodomensis]|uniref:Nitrate/nitrite sensing protein domain-containing protein n=1 Tax=Rhodovibrio sodomensis TaxID=1088 RepID=A0ABS1DPU7_9PROT|nr:hypothetical protein [Rhodovibrio sodomensis]